MKKLHLVGTQVLELESNKTMNLRYYLTECHKADNSAVQYYGVQIEKKEEADSPEVEWVDYISSSKDIVLNMVEKLAKHTVTPISMVTIVDDIVTELMCS